MSKSEVIIAMDDDIRPGIGYCDALIAGTQQGQWGQIGAAQAVQKDPPADGVIQGTHVHDGYAVVVDYLRIVGGPDIRLRYFDDYELQARLRSLGLRLGWVDALLENFPNGAASGGLQTSDRAALRREDAERAQELSGGLIRAVERPSDGWILDVDWDAYEKQNPRSLRSDYNRIN